MSETPTAPKPARQRKPPTSAATGLALRQQTDLTSAEEAERGNQLVLEFESPSAYQLALPVPLRSRYTTYIVFSMFCLLFLVSALFPIDRVVSGAGQVVTVEPQVGIAALDTGIVREIVARPGQVVHKGDLLMTLDPTNAIADLTSYEEQVASLTHETDRLKAELAGRVYSTDGTKYGDAQAVIYAQRHSEITMQMENYGQKIEALKGPLRQARSDITQYTERLALASKVEQKRRELERLQVGSQLNTLSATDTRTEMSRLLEAARAQAVQAQGSLDAMTAERDQTLENWRAQTSQTLNDENIKLLSAQQALDKARLAARMVELRAPMDATVLNVAPTNTGTVVTTGSQLMQLTPLDSPLEVEVLFAAMDAGNVIPGQRATIKFDTFPYTLHGTASGKVRVISPDSTREPYNPISAPASLTSSQQAMGQLYFKGRVTLEALHLVAVPEGFHPTPGMQVTVDVLAGHRTFLAYLFQRVVPSLTEGFREP
jgi:HlyD family type I secretion membrane fusion protein